MLFAACTACAQQDLPRVAILDFSASGTLANDSSAISGKVRDAFVKTAMYVVIDRPKMLSILAGQELQQSGCAEKECAARIGQFLNARKMIVGEYALMGDLGYVSALLVDVGTGAIEKTGSVKGFNIKNADEAADNLVGQLTGISLNVSGASETKTSPEKKELPTAMIGKDGVAMALVPSGTYMMGASGTGDSTPAHRVRIDAFYIDVCEVTNQQYADFLNAWGKTTDANNEIMIVEFRYGLRKKGGKWEPQPGYEKHPVINVTWYGANQYALYYKKRLPSEAEWEMACRAGSEGKWCFGDTGKLGDYACYEANSLKKPGPVGQKRANLLGINDMHGNVWEWCFDWYDPVYYNLSPRENPPGPSLRKYKVIRGGSWQSFAGDCRSSKRESMEPGDRNDTVSFRCAVSALEKEAVDEKKPQDTGTQKETAGAYAKSLELYMSGQYDEAMKMVLPVIGDNPKHWQALQLIGNCLYAKGDKAGALEYYRKSLEVNPDNQQLKKFADGINTGK